MGHHGANWGPTGANLSQLGAILGPTWGQLDQVGPTWANMRQLGANLGPTWHQLGAILGSVRANLDRLGPTRSQLRPARANMTQRGPTWGQLKPIMGAKIIEKPLFFLGFFDTSKKSLEALGDALGDLLESLGGALGTPREPLGNPILTPGKAKRRAKPGKAGPTQGQGGNGHPTRPSRAPTLA